MRTEGVDPRDVTWERDQPVYRVYFWRRGTAPAHVPPDRVGFYCRENRVVGAADVHEVIAWADRTADPDETYTLYVEHQHQSETGLIQLAGTDPTINRSTRDDSAAVGGSSVHQSGSTEPGGRP